MREIMKKAILVFSIIAIIFLAFSLLFRECQNFEAGNLSKEEKVKAIFETLKKEEPQREEFRSIDYPFLKADFFQKAENSFKKKKIDFILADLSSKKLYFYQKGILRDKFDILTIGKEGSFWETPAGFYQVEAKIEKAFSSLGHVYMPYSLQFQGNFFIHGWPYYPGGKPVRSTFSGGCIRLSTESAKALYGEVAVGTPVLITEDKFQSDRSRYSIKKPPLSARAFLAADLGDNFIFSEKNPTSTYPIASLTKLVTALTAVEYVNLWKTVRVEKSDLIYTSKPRLKVGETYTGFELLYPLLMESSNEAAMAMTHFLGRKRFVELMDKKARSVGMENASFADAYGGSSADRASLKDLFYLAKYLYFNRRFVLNITKGKIYYSLLSQRFENLGNFNCFYREPDFIGGKIGKTSAAKETMIAIFKMKFGEEERPVALIVLGADDACGEVQKLKDWLEENFVLEAPDNRN